MISIETPNSYHLFKLLKADIPTLTVHSAHHNDRRFKIIQMHLSCSFWKKSSNLLFKKHLPKRKRKGRISEQPGRRIPEFWAGASELPCDFPSHYKIQKLLQAQNFTRFLLDMLDGLLTNDIPWLQVLLF